jgi:hypothetical protein
MLAKAFAMTSPMLVRSERLRLRSTWVVRTLFLLRINLPRLNRLQLNLPYRLCRDTNVYCCSPSWGVVVARQMEFVIFLLEIEMDLLKDLLSGHM